MSYVPNAPMPLSPVEERLNDLPRGNADWPGYAAVYHAISKGCERIGLSKMDCGGDLHVESMAILGCGHEETMKYQKLLLMDLGWIKEEDLHD